MLRLVVGLGNPGREYERTRHNAGFWWVERLAQKFKVELRGERKFNGLAARITSSHDCWLLLPQTYMNLSGQSVEALAGFYKIAPEEILVVHDELDLLAGAAKLKLGGGAAGHNGLKDISARIGQNYWRLRLGIGHPGQRDIVVEYVLRAPSADDAQRISQAIDRSMEVWPLMQKGEMEKAMHALHTKAGDGKREA